MVPGVLGVVETVGVAVTDAIFERDGVFDTDPRGDGSREGDCALTPEKTEYTDTEQGCFKLLHLRTVQQTAAMHGAGPWLFAPIANDLEVMPA